MYSTAKLCGFDCFIFLSNLFNEVERIFVFDVDFESGGDHPSRVSLLPVDQLVVQFVLFDARPRIGVDPAAQLLNFDKLNEKVGENAEFKS